LIDWDKKDRIESNFKKTAFAIAMFASVVASIFFSPGMRGWTGLRAVGQVAMMIGAGVYLLIYPVIWALFDTFFVDPKP